MITRHDLVAATVALTLLSPGAAFAVDIGTLHCNDANGNNLDNGSTVTVTGAVTLLYNKAATLQMFIQDATGGILVFGGSQSQYCGNLGDNITVTGKVAQYHGLTEVTNPLTVTLNSTGNPLPPPLALTPAQVNATFQADYCEPNEGVLAQLACVYIRTAAGEVPAAGATFAGNTDYLLVDAFDPTSSTILFITPPGTNTACPEFNPLIGQPIPLTCQTVTGVLTQYTSSSPYTSGYEMFPRLLTDLSPCGATPARSTSWGSLKTLYR